MRTLTLGMGIGPEGPTFELCEKIETDDGKVILPMANLYMQIKDIEEVQKAIDTINRFSDPLNGNTNLLEQSNEC